MYSILIVEDDSIMNNGVRIYLEKNGYQVKSVYSVREAEKEFVGYFNLVILDINLPDGDGLELCAKIRKDNKVPIIFITANDTDENIVDGFKAGGDDYIAKPFALEVLHQRIKAVLRRSEDMEGKSDIFTYKDLRVDFKRMSVSIKDELVKLSATEYKLLEILIKNKGQVLTRESLLNKVWDIEGNYVDENTLSVHIKRLRNKLGDDGKNAGYIITVFGIGYTFGE